MTRIMPVNSGKNVVISLINARQPRPQKGQGMTEYIIIVALIAVAAIAVYQFFGQTIRSQTSAIANEVAGKSGATAMTAAGTAATGSNGEQAKKGLSNYADGASKAAGAAAGQ